MAEYYCWMDPKKKHKDMVSSWRQTLLDHDRQTLKNSLCRTADEEQRQQQEQRRSEHLDRIITDDARMDEEPKRKSTLHRCPQVWLFPPRPELSDLIPTSIDTTSDYETQSCHIPAVALRTFKHKRQRLRNKSRSTPPEPQTLIPLVYNKTDNGSHQQQVETSRTPAGATEPAIQTAEVSDNEKELMELQVAVSNLHSKLEMLQPIGMRPSDLATAAERSTVRADDILVGDSENSDEKEEAGDHEEVLSQVPTSQCSVLLWDELQVLVATSSSSVIKLRELVDSAVSELGLEHLEDGVLNRLCSEIFEDTQGAQNTEIAKDIEDGLVTNAKTLQLSYPGSLFLFRVLFYQKALHIKSKPSRLFLHSIVHAGRNHGRAIVDAILLPLFRDYERYSKVSSELVQNVLKEQTSAGMIHFLSMVLDSVVGPDTSGSSHDSSLSKFPVLFMTETHLDTMKSVLGYANVPSPLPSRLWIRFNNVLEMLWDQLAVMVSSTSLSSSCHSILKLYSSSGDLKGPSSTSDQNQRLRDSGQDPLRLSNLNLVQLVMTWTMRQGPMCQDVDSLQRLRQFCAMRMDVKQCKNLVAKLDMFIKRKTKKQ